MIKNVSLCLSFHFLFCFVVTSGSGENQCKLPTTHTHTQQHIVQMVDTVYGLCLNEFTSSF